MPQEIHRSVFDAVLAGDLIAYFIAPGAVHGTGTGPVKTIATFPDQQLAGLYGASGYAFYVGEGSSVFEFVSHCSTITD